MQRAKHAERKRLTRVKILIGDAVERAQALDVAPEEIEAVLAHYVVTGGEPALRAFVSTRLRTNLPNEGSGGAATRRGAVFEMPAKERGDGSP